MDSSSWPAWKDLRSLPDRKGSLVMHPAGKNFRKYRKYKAKVVFSVPRKK